RHGEPQRSDVRAGDGRLVHLTSLDAREGQLLQGYGRLRKNNFAEQTSSLRRKSGESVATCTEVDVKATLETWIRDFRHAARGLVRTPGFTLTVVATLALAI